MNYTDLQAAIGRVQLARFQDLQLRRFTIAKVYVERLGRLGLVEFQDDVLEPGHARHLFLIKIRDESLRRLKLTRDGILRKLREANIGASVHYHPLHLMPLYQSAPRGPMSVTEDIGSRVLTLPIGSAMSEADAHYVCDHLEAIFS
jgi:dTDP-4-amino-4,6-dideoxygalactose transaminase